MPTAVLFCGVELWLGRWVVEGGVGRKVEVNLPSDVANGVTVGLEQELEANLGGNRGNYASHLYNGELHLLLPCVYVGGLVRLGSGWVGTDVF